MMKAMLAATNKKMAIMRATPATSLILSYGVASENINIKIMRALQKVSFANTYALKIGVW